MAKLRDRGKSPEQHEQAETLPDYGEYSPPFVLMHHRRQWTWKDGAWLPIVKPFKLIPGANGVRGTPENPEWSATRAYHESQGYRFIPTDIEVFYEDEDGDLVRTINYQLRYDGSKGPHYTDVWQVPIDAGDKVLWEQDDAGWNAWLGWLVEAGHIQPPVPAVLRQNIAVQENRVSNLAKNAHGGAAPSVKHEYETELAKLEAMRASLEPTVGKRRKLPRGKPAEGAANGQG